MDKYTELANAIVLQAVEDYRKALSGKKIKGVTPERTIRDVEKFFRSEWFAVLTRVDGEMLMEKIKGEVKNERHIKTIYQRPH
jgi:hypothetical protein